MSIEQLHKYYLFAQAVDPQELQADTEVDGSGIDVEGYGRCFFVVNIGDMDASELVLEVSSSGIGQVGWTSEVLTSGWASADEAFGVDVSLLSNTISGYIRASVEAIGDVCDCGVTAILYERTGILPDDNQVTVTEL